MRHHDSKYFLPCLDTECAAAENIEVVCQAADQALAAAVATAATAALAHLENFYSPDVKPAITVFIYPDLAAMSQAFGREIKSADWCFAPIITEPALIAFTAGLRGSFSQVLTHEFSHVYFASLTGNQPAAKKFCQTIPCWLDEGIALNLDAAFRPEDFPATVRRRREILQTKETAYFPDLTDMYTYFNRLDEEKSFSLAHCQA